MMARSASGWSAIRELLSLSDEPDCSCSEVDEMARRRRDDIDARIKQLKSLRGELTRMINACAGGKVAECQIIGVLSDGAKVDGKPRTSGSADS
jgi:hypothetical protein